MRTKKHLLIGGFAAVSLALLTAACGPAPVSDDRADRVTEAMDAAWADLGQEEQDRICSEYAAGADVSQLVAVYLEEVC